MLFRVSLLFVLAVAACYAFIECFRHIDGKHWKLVGKTLAKLVFSIIFGATVVVFCGVLSHLTN
jgi:hypothetical protein